MNFEKYTTKIRNMTSKLLKIALCQLSVTSNKSQNIKSACGAIQNAVKSNNAELVVLPECFNSPYGTKFFPEYAEKLDNSETLKAISECAKENNVYVVAGSIPTLENEKYYNTSTVFNSSGELIAVHRKVHLFDIDIPGKITFRESEILSPGKQLTYFDIKRDGKEIIRVGLGICFDVRFAEMAQILTQKGCKLLVYPGAFNMTTGPAHWELLARGRAIDNQLWVAMCSPARNPSAGYVAWGHSLVVNPYAEVVAEAQEKEETVVYEIDINRVDEIRNQIPVFSTKYDSYTVNYKNEKKEETM